MPFLDRLMQDSGIAVGAAQTAAAAARAGAVPSFEVVETVEPVPVTPVLPVARPAAVSQPAVPEHGVADPSPDVEAPPGATPAMPVVPDPAPATPLEAAASVVARDAPAVGSPRLAEPPRDPTEERFVQPAPSDDTPAERVLRTLAAVRSWTAATPAPGEAPVGREVIEPDVIRSRDAGAQSVEIVQAPAVRSQLRDAVSRPGPQPQQPEPEVVNLSVSIGSIEVSVEGPEAAQPVASPETQRPAASAPDAVSRLRRYYYRPPIGW